MYVRDVAKPCSHSMNGSCKLQKDSMSAIFCSQSMARLRIEWLKSDSERYESSLIPLPFNKLIEVFHSFDNLSVTLCY